MKFEGFPVETFRYLTDLTLHNDKAWFDANRKRYESQYLAPAIAIIEALGPRLRSELQGAVKYDARVNGSLFRINRDVRFSNPRARFLLHERLHTTLEQPIPPEAHDAAFVDYCLAHYKAMSPINVWLGALMRGLPIN